MIAQKIDDLVKSGELDGIAEVLDSSAGKQTRLVIRLKRDANANVVLNKLYKHTPLQTSFGVNMLALVDGVPRTLNLAQVLNHYLAHQVEVVTRRTEFRLRKAPRANTSSRGCSPRSTCSTRSSPRSEPPTTDPQH